MFSYRHAYHVGNHADVLKHLTILAVLRHLTQKDTALSVVDTHAGAGLYRLDSYAARHSGEAASGIVRLVERIGSATVPPALRDYLDMVLGCQPRGAATVYPGSPLLMWKALRPQDRLALVELHPRDAKTLRSTLGKQDKHDAAKVTILQSDGFDAVRQFLPPPSRRGFVLCDPSYEIKSDYDRVLAMVSDSLRRFPTGTYAIWYPILPRYEAHQLPRKLKTLAQRAGIPWLHATLSIAPPAPGATTGAHGLHDHGLLASGMFVLRPPFTLEATLRDALLCLTTLLPCTGKDAVTVETSARTDGTTQKE
ncbi:23S rRNA (adenine(2030)-N(6))-methyltransferase RlmJ [Candidatus Symbiobacter mobilis]|uniref:Ribosomal RNA large subunit methyltransferase J n=1 Tax=Candidatus Symbiobacter mobilis CR TaxID=946483 RepID=U5N751_9BURK|nr:23S rRNA (adenine(2030)-N(6))-methyltransferase RlmJ [Candidatus Symbiobacter mobilis]AGX87222.1 hypothetical protein Cenrod_1129 [Candidatus Symbiobacter mobilis CR]